MAISTYADLRSAVAAWVKPNTTLTSDETSSRIPQYVQNSRAELQRVLAAAKFSRLDNLTASLTVTSGVATLPTGFQGVRSIRQTTEPYALVTWQPVDILESLTPTAVSQPRYYDVVGSSLVVWPAITTTVRMRWTGSLTTLSSDTDTDWLITENPDLSLMAAVLEADLRVDVEEMRAKWEAAYARKLAQLIELDRQRPEQVRPLANGVVI